MDNDVLINQARQLYADLLVGQAKRFAATEHGARFENLISAAYCRYERRLNRCVVCYQQRRHDCIRQPGEKTVDCDFHRQGGLDSAAKAALC